MLRAALRSSLETNRLRGFKEGVFYSATVLVILTMALVPLLWCKIKIIIVFYFYYATEVAGSLVAQRNLQHWTPLFLLSFIIVCHRPVTVFLPEWLRLVAMMF